MLSYDRFYPGRILGNTFTVKNVSDGARKVRIRFELQDKSPVAIKDHLLEYFEVSSPGQLGKSFTKHLF